MPASKLLLTGATGYIGGSVLSRLLSSEEASVKSLDISVLLRTAAQAEFISSLGLNTILYQDLADYDALTRAASENDIVIHTADSAANTKAAEALILGLEQRRKTTRQDVYFIHTTGTSIVSDFPITKTYIETRVLSDAKDDIRAYEKAREAISPWPFRQTDLAVLDTADRTGVQPVIVTLPTVYGEGSGMFKKTSIQLPVLAHAAVAAGQALFVGEGAGLWNRVHVADAAALYELLVARVVRGESVPTGTMFGATQFFTWKELAETMGRVGFEKGLLKTAEARSATLEEATGWVGGNAVFAEVAFGSRTAVIGDKAVALGWKEEKGQIDWEAELARELQSQ